MEKIRQEISRHINSKNNMWVALIASTGGTLALLFNLDSLTKIIFFIIGILSIIILLSIYRSKGHYIDYLIEKIGEKDDSK